MVSSKVEFNGIAGIFSLPIVITGASRYLKHSSCIFPAKARAKLLLYGSSVTTKHFPVFLTDFIIVVSSKGKSVRKSMIST